MSRGTIITIFVFLGVVIIAQPVAWAQGAKSAARYGQNRAKLLEEANRQMKDARARQIYEEALRKKQEVVRAAEIAPLEEMANAVTTSSAVGPEQLEREEMAKALLKRARETASSEAEAIMNTVAELESEKMVTQRAVPISEAVAQEQKSKPLKTATGDPLPEPALDKKPRAINPAGKEPAQPLDITEIDAKGGAYFHASKKIIIFTKDVVVDHPGFNLECDKLEIFLHQDAALPGAQPGGNAAATPTEPAAGGVAATGPVAGIGGSKAIERAIATGYVVITKQGSGGDLQVGKARHATFESASGDVILRDYPQVQRGANLIIATDRTTTIVLRQDGNMEVHGPSKTEIVKEVKEKPIAAGRPLTP